MTRPPDPDEIGPESRFNAWMLESELARLDSDIAWVFDRWITRTIRRLDDVPPELTLALTDAVASGGIFGHDPRS